MTNGINWNVIVWFKMYLISRKVKMSERESYIYLHTVHTYTHTHTYGKVELPAFKFISLSFLELL